MMRRAAEQALAKSPDTDGEQVDTLQEWCAACEQNDNDDSASPPVCKECNETMDTRFKRKKLALVFLRVLPRSMQRPEHVDSDHPQQARDDCGKGERGRACGTRAVCPVAKILV